MTFSIVNLDKGSEEMFWNHVNKDPLNYYFFILDWKFAKDDTRILMALERGEVRGMMIVFKNKIVHVRGERTVVGELLENLDMEEVEMMVPMDCEDLVLEKYDPEIKNQMHIMHLEKGERIIQREHEPMELSIDDAGQISKIMNESLPDWWGNYTPEMVREKMGDMYWLGIKDGGEVLSFGNTRFLEFGSNIGVVATHKDHRNKGYATSVVAGLAEKILERSDKALIHVLRDNHPAVHTYSKVGFKLFRPYFLVKKAKKKR